MAQSGKRGCFRQFLITFFILLLFFAGAVIGGWLFISQMSSKPTLKSNTYLTWSISEIAEYKESQLFQFKQPLTMGTLRSILDSAGEDSRIEGVLVNFTNQAISRSDIEEIREMIIDFKGKGKKFYAYADGFSMSNYRLASLADKIFMPDTTNAIISFTGYSVYSPYMKDMLDKLGINMQVMHQGEYKGAGENLNRTTMSEAIKEDYRFIFGGLFDTITDDIAQNRGMDTEEFKNDVLSGKYAILTPTEALHYGLIDQLAYYRSLKDIISDGKEINYFGISQYSPKFSRAKQKIAIVYAEGEIRTGKSSNQFSPFGGYTRVLGSDTVVSQFQEILKDDSIKGVVFRINSPGGSALASQLMYDAIREVNEKKPVIVSMSSVAASGGYYIAMASRSIVVQPSTITGSIGVVSIFPDLSEMYDSMGINFDGFHEGKYSDFGSTHRPLSDEEKELYNKIAGNIYTEFKTRVSDCRNIAMDDLEILARGRVYTGLQAIEFNLADEIGGLPRAIELLKAELNIPADENVLLIQYPKEKKFFEMLSESDFISRIYKDSNMEIYGRLVSDFSTWIERAFYYDRNSNPLMLYTGPAYIE